MKYRGGGNTIFFVSNARYFGEQPRIVIDAFISIYGTRDFQIWQCGEGFMRHDSFFVRFKDPLAKLIEELLLEPKKIDGGVKATSN